MEKIMSTEDKIRRAEEIYNRRKENQYSSYTTKVNINSKKDLKLLKKIFIQIIVCFVIYSLFNIIKNNNYIFSEDLINKTKDILSYDINFNQIYSKGLETLRNYNFIQKEENTQEKKDSIENIIEENAIGGAEAKENENQETNEISQMEKDALEIKKSISFINPIEGTITSNFGWRNPSTSTVPKYHTGVDIANVSGTKIYSATDGIAVMVSEVGDYRKAHKNTKW